MKKLFVAAALIGSLVTGAAVFAQSTTATGTTISTTTQNTTAVVCSPSITSVPVGQSATLTASGGDGSYMWSSPGLVINNPTGANFSVAFNAVGTYPVSVTSAGTIATCSVSVTGAVVVPGLPNTGELPE